MSGSLWAKAQWGSYWNWDPRETTIFFLLLIYGAYLALRSAIEGEEKRARLAAVYSVIAFVTVPFLYLRGAAAVRHAPPVAHPAAAGRGAAMDPRIRICFLAMLVGFTALFFWILSLKVRLVRTERRALSESAAEV